MTAETGRNREQAEYLNEKDAAEDQAENPQDKEQDEATSATQVRNTFRH